GGTDYNGNYLVEVVVNGIASTATPWTLNKQGSNHTWTPGAPGGPASAPPSGPVFRPAVVTQPTVPAADDALTAAPPSGRAMELPLESSATGAETSSHPSAWESAVAHVLANQITAPDPTATELAFLDLGDGNLQLM